jgi:glutathione S-transferase
MGIEVPRSSSGWGNFDTMIEVLENGLKDKDWLLGDDFTAADVLVGSSVYFMKKFGILPESPVLEAYVERCLERPAYQKALARDSELKG